MKKTLLTFPTRLTLIQAFLVLACAGFQPLLLSYWDAGWYRGIVDLGYRSDFPDARGNVGFFPGYPAVALILKTVFSFGVHFLSTDFALLLVSLSFSFLLFNFLSTWIQTQTQNPAQAEPRIQHAKLILFALYPFSFFFYTAYSESLFTASVVGFILFSEKLLQGETHKDRNFCLALAFGFLMCFTRLLGLVFIVYPIFRALQIQQKKLPALFLLVGSSLGCALFFAYCYFQFGAWDFYFISERAIWGSYFDWHKLFPPTTLFHLTPPFKGDTIGKVVTVVFGVYLTKKLFELIREKAFRDPLFALILVNGMYWGANFLGRTSLNFVGMGRYLLPGIALMLPFINVNLKSKRTLILVTLIFLALQIGYVITFVQHGWVA
jgi:hypothetical protein